jgi:predicted RNase H-like nuclease
MSGHRLARWRHARDPQINRSGAAQPATPATTVAPISSPSALWSLQASVLAEAYGWRHNSRVGGGRILGVDGCAAGWIGIALAENGVRAYAAAKVPDLVEAADADGRIDVVGIDIPIGLPDVGRRRADVLARKEAGPRWASVFMTPVRAAVLAPSFDAALAQNRLHAGEGVSRQAFALGPKILEVDQWVREEGRRVVEVHPELSFAGLAGAPLPFGKNTWAGSALRRRVLGEAGVILPDDLGGAGDRCRVDDVLDAAAAAWTARRVSRGEAWCLPDPPESFSDGLKCAIWI